VPWAYSRQYEDLLLGRSIEPIDPTSYPPPCFASEFGLSDQLGRCARELLTTGRERGQFSGKSPVGLAAASIRTGEPVTQRAIAAVSDITEVMIRNRYGELLELAKDRGEN
jgi:transcription initiation factor TFIIB